jgi:hypothetical protein
MTIHGLTLAGAEGYDHRSSEEKIGQPHDYSDGNDSARREDRPDRHQHLANAARRFRCGTQCPSLTNQKRDTEVF